MALNIEQAARAPTRGLDTAVLEAAQAAASWRQREQGESRLRLRTLVTSRWLVLAGQLAALAGAHYIFDVEAPYGLALALIGVAAALNIATAALAPRQRVMGSIEATLQLGFDVLEIAGLLYLTGGATNPFVVMLIAPVALAAATLPLRPFLVLGGVACLVVVLLAVVAWPAPFAPMHHANDLTYRLGASAATVTGLFLIAGYVRQAAEEAGRMALALDVTQAVLAREQRLSALGALAAAAAHELGTPLATISIVAKEISHSAGSADIREDAELLVAQAERCREILQRLTATPHTAHDDMHERMSLLQLVQEVIEPHTDQVDVRVEAIVSGAPGAAAPDIRRRPEILHALTSLVENAFDFATAEVLVTARFDERSISIEVRDDGPGFAAEVLSKLGEPYVTTRPGAEGSRSGHVGMGLGFFIAKTLLERTGAVVRFQNGKPRGAVISARWVRTDLEVADHR